MEAAHDHAHVMGWSTLEGFPRSSVFDEFLLCLLSLYCHLFSSASFCTCAISPDIFVIFLLSKVALHGPNLVPPGHAPHLRHFPMRHPNTIKKLSGMVYYAPMVRSRLA